MFSVNSKHTIGSSYIYRLCVHVLSSSIFNSHFSKSDFVMNNLHQINKSNQVLCLFREPSKYPPPWWRWSYHFQAPAAIFPLDLSPLPWRSWPWAGRSRPRLTSCAWSRCPALWRSGTRCPRNISSGEAAPWQWIKRQTLPHVVSVVARVPFAFVPTVTSIMVIML